MWAADKIYSSVDPAPVALRFLIDLPGQRFPKRTTIHLGGLPMMKSLIAMTVLALTSGIAFADEKPSADEAGKIAATAKAWGCSGGEAEKEGEATGVYELNDAKCADGANYDIKLDKAFKVLSITAD
jgi:hypothetical protein